jgi:hypothetical protein
MEHAAFPAGPSAEGPVLRRLNLDSSWHLAWAGGAFVLDPWLLGSEVDIARWFNEQWHVLDPVPPAELPPFDVVVVTQAYSDHCHEATLRALPAGTPLWCSPRAAARLRKDARLAPAVSVLPDALDGPGRALGGLRLSVLDPGRRLDPVYYALLVECGTEALLYAPHGFAPSAAQAERLAGRRVRLVMTTCITYRLPALLGGAVNPGLEAAAALAAASGAEALIDTHDEDKRARGLVQRLARVVRPSAERVAAALPPGTRLLRTEGYAPLSLDAVPA